MGNFKWFTEPGENTCIVIPFIALDRVSQIYDKEVNSFQILPSQRKLSLKNIQILARRSV